jgi:hypothetical protein
LILAAVGTTEAAMTRARLAIAPLRHIAALGPQLSLRSFLRAVALVIVVAVVAFEAFLLLGGYRIFVGEERVRLGEHRVVEGWGDLAERKQPSLVCDYFTGTGIQPHVFVFSHNGMLGRDDCPLILAE